MSYVPTRQRQVLELLQSVHADGRPGLTAPAIADFIGVTGTQACHVLKVLDEKGLVSWARGSLAHLTPLGLETKQIEPASNARKETSVTVGDAPKARIPRRDTIVECHVSSASGVRLSLKYDSADRKAAAMAARLIDVAIGVA